MEYLKTRFFNLKRKRDLKKILKNKLSGSFINSANSSYTPFLINSIKPRLIENPHDELKKVQRKIKNILFELDYPKNVFSGVPKRSYIDNAIYHINSDCFLKIDLSKFFPNTHREKVYNFYKEKLNTSADIAKILTNLSTVNLEGIANNEINTFLKSNKILSYNHLPSGSPTSSVLSYLANIDMFDEIQNTCDKNNCIVSFYVDDITISSSQEITKPFFNKILKIISKHNHIVNTSKIKTYFSNDFKKITGCVISKDKRLVVPSKTMFKINALIKENVFEERELQRLTGLIKTAQSYEKEKLKNLLNFVKIRKKELKNKNV